MFFSLIFPSHKKPHIYRPITIVIIMFADSLFWILLSMESRGFNSHCWSRCFTTQGSINMDIGPIAWIYTTFCWHDLYLIPAWRSYHMFSKLWYEINPLPNAKGASVAVWKRIIDFIPHFITDVLINEFWDQRKTHFKKGHLECLTWKQRASRFTKQWYLLSSVLFIDMGHLKSRHG